MEPVTNRELFIVWYKSDRQVQQHINEKYKDLNNYPKYRDQSVPQEFVEQSLAIETFYEENSAALGENIDN